MSVKQLRWAALQLFLVFCLLTVPSRIVFAEDATSLRQLFTKLDSVNNGTWYAKNHDNSNSSFTWGESYVMDSYLYMYEATGDQLYLDKFVSHANGVLSWRDNLKGYQDYQGQSLPGWSTLSNGKRMHFVDEGMIVYPMVKFAYMVYKDPILKPYKSRSNIYIKAAQKLVAIFDPYWVDDRNMGYYTYPRASPIWCDGIEVPFNQQLALARCQLYLYLVTNDKLYLERVTKLAWHFKSNLVFEQETNSYTWHYWYGSGFLGWLPADNRSKNTPSYQGYKSFEDLTHGAIDLQFAYEAYQTGIVFTELDMVRFGNTLEKRIIRQDGTYAAGIDGMGNADISSFSYGGLGNYLHLHKYTPSLYSACYNIYTTSKSTKGGGLQVIALLNKAYGEKTGLVTVTTNKPIGRANIFSFVHTRILFGFLSVFIFSAFYRLITRGNK